MTLVKMALQVLLALLAFLELQGTLVKRARRVTLVKANLDQEDPLACQDQRHHAQRPFLIWKVPDSLIWTAFGDPKGFLVFRALLAPLALLQPPTCRLGAKLQLGHLDQEGLMGRMAFLVFKGPQAPQVLQEIMANQDWLDPEEKRVMQAIWDFLELLVKRVQRVMWVPLVFQGRQDWLVFLDQWDQLDSLAPLDLQAQASQWALMIWKGQHLDQYMVQESEGQMDGRVFLDHLVCQAYRVTMDCLVFQEQREKLGLQDSQGLMDSQG